MVEPNSRTRSLTLGVVGAGAMGRGVAQVAVMAGVDVLIHDARPGAAAEACDFVREMLGKLVTKEKISAAEANDAISRLRSTDSLDAFASCDMVLEAIVESLEVKRDLFKRLDGIVDDRCVLATNTSSLSVSALAAGSRIPERIAGFHFFNPVPLMKIVEVIQGALTESWVIDFLKDLAVRMGHHPVVCKDTPGFVVNHAGRGYLTEALRILGEGCAEAHEIDQIMRDVVGFRLGPFELLDLTGLDVSHPVMESIYHQYYQEPRYRPSPITAQRMVAGLLGRKSGRGFYSYNDGKPTQEHAEVPPDDRPRRVWVSRRSSAYCAQLCQLVKALGGEIDDQDVPAPDSLCIVMPVGQDATTSALEEGLDATRTVAIDPLFGFDKRRTLMTTPVTAPSMRRAAHGLFSADGTPVSVIKDSPGFVAQRIVAQIVNVGCDIAQQNIASPLDIDRAVALGLGYPQGPLNLGDTVGGETVLTVLDSMLTFYGDPRYRPSPWLKRRAKLRVSLLTTETR